MRVHLLAISALPLFWSGVSLSAEPLGTHLEGISGKVLVSQGEGFVAATSNLTLGRGTKIFVGDDSTATLSFARGKNLGPCYVALKPTSVTTVSDADMCKADQEASPGAFEATTITPVAGDPPPSGISPPMVAAGFVTIVAGVTVYTLLHNDHSRSVSPP
jgi:hypothetical protein